MDVSWTPETLEAAERSLLAEEEAEAAYQARQRARAAAEDAWVDRVVAEHESLAAARREAAGPSTPAPAAGGADAVAAAEGAASAAADWERWELALAPHGLGLLLSGEPGGGGRGLAAKRGFARGEVILRVSPAAFVVNDANLRTCCHHCLARDRKLLCCSRCGCARYCSMEHQRAAWLEHKDECALLARTRPRVPGQTIRLLARVLSLLRRAAEAGGAAGGGKTASGGASNRGKKEGGGGKAEAEGGKKEGGGGAGNSASGGESGDAGTGSASYDPAKAREAGRWAGGAGGALSLRHQMGRQTEPRAKEFREQAAMLCSLIADVASGGGGGGACCSSSGNGGSVGGGGAVVAACNRGGGGRGKGSSCGGGGGFGGASGGSSVGGGSSSGNGGEGGRVYGGGRGWSTTRPPPVQTASQMLSLLSLNCHTITDDELIELGTGLYPLAALANHSCLPTAVQTFGPNAQLTLRALVPLAPGDEVTIAYVDLSLSRAERQAALRYAYLFECRCPACVPAPGVSAATDAARETERARMARALNQAGEMESRALDAEDWATALAQAEVGCQLAGALLSPTSPALGLHLLRAAKLHAHCGSLGTAAAFARRAAAILTVTHGEKADVVGQATEQLRGAQMELAFGPRGGHPRADGAMASGLRLSGEHPRQ